MGSLSTLEEYSQNEERKHDTTVAFIHVESIGYDIFIM